MHGRRKRRKGLTCVEALAFCSASRSVHCSPNSTRRGGAFNGSLNGSCLNGKAASPSRSSRSSRNGMGGTTRTSMMLLSDEVEVEVEVMRATIDGLTRGDDANTVSDAPSERSNVPEASASGTVTRLPRSSRHTPSKRRVPGDVNKNVVHQTFMHGPEALHG